MRQHPRLPLSALCLLLLALAVPSALDVEAARPGPAAPAAPAAPTVKAASGDAAARVRQNYGLLPLSFEPNRGQADARVQFLARNGAYSLYLTPGEMTLALRNAGARERDGRAAPFASALRIRLLGASARARAYGLGEMEGKSNYLVGHDPARWRTDVPHYGRVRYEGVYPGVDVVYYGTNRQLEYDFNLAPGADAGLIRLSFEGAGGLRVEEGGDLVLKTAAGEVRQHAPLAYQEVGGVRREVACRYVLGGASRVGFRLGEYDRGLPLVIDPVVSYSTFLGGGGYDEGNAVAVDSEGNAYVTGYATSTDFPVTPGALQPTRRGANTNNLNYDVFVSKLNPAGTALVYSTYLGGSGSDHGVSVAVDAAGRAHVGGVTDSADFPTTAGAYRTTWNSSQDIFVSKLDAGGSSLLYSTYLGGSDYEQGGYLGLGGGGEIYVAGRTHSANFPATPGAFQTQGHNPRWGASEGFVTKLSPAAGAGLIFSTFLGGSAEDMVEGLAVARGLDDSVYVTGRTNSTDFPNLPGTVQPGHSGEGWTYDAFVTRLNSAGTQAVYSTYYGGTGDEYGSGVAVDATGAAYFVGLTSSQFLQTTPGAFQETYAGGPAGGPAAGNNDYDGFVAKLRPDGGQLAYATYYGGHGGDKANAVAVDAEGNAYVTGETNSTDLPVGAGGVQTAFGGGQFDGFFFKLDAAGAALHYGTYLGGDDWEQARGVALGAGGDVYLTGNTYSYNFPTTPGAFRPNRSSGYGGDAFVAKLALGVQDFEVGGRVTNEYGNGLRDVEVRVTSDGSVVRVVRTDADGRYVVNGLAGGLNLSLTAERLGFTFSPEAATIENLSQDETRDFSGPAPLVIKGRVYTPDSGYGLYLPITLTSSASAGQMEQMTNYDGSYTFVVPAGGTYTVAPGPSDQYTFVPASRTFENMTGDQALDFKALYPPRIVGRVENEWGYSYGNASVTVTGPSLAAPLVQTTDSSGYFFFSEGLERGATYTVTPADPAAPNRTFTPAQRVLADIQGPEFITFSARPPVAISGRIADDYNYPVTGTVKLTGAVNAQVETDQWGYFSFLDLPRGGDYTVTVTKPGSLYTFDPPSQSVTNLQDMQFLNFRPLPPVRIGGRVASPDGGNGVRATLTLSGSASATTQADEYGFFMFEELPRGGDYTVTASLPLYTFNPPSQSVTNLQDFQFFAFEALPPLRIRGSFVDGSGNGVPGVAVTLSGAVNATATADQYGNYEFNDLPRGGSYVVTPAHELYVFSPASQSFPSMSRDEIGFFNAAPRRFTLSGRVADDVGAPLPNVNVRLGGAELDVRLTDANGNYSFNPVVGRNYTLTAERAGYSFAPASVSVNDARADRTANFTGSHLTYTIGGRITDKADGSAVAGATVTLGGGRSATAQTDAEGNYSFPGLPSEGDYSVHVSHPHFTFGFPTITYYNLLSDMTGVNWQGNRRTFAVSGSVTDPGGRALSGVTVTLSGAQPGTMQTDSFGGYVFSGLPAGRAYTLTASKKYYSFAEPSRQIESLDGDMTVAFRGTRQTYGISGRVVDAGGNGFAGATVRIVGLDRAVTTDATGYYAFTALPAGGNYTVEPARQFYSFGPARADFLDLVADQTANFTATLDTFSVGGRVAEGAVGVAGVTVNLTGTRTATAQTDAAGNYLFAGLPANGTYAMTPAANPVYSFSPGGASFNTLPSDQTANFAATRLTYQVSGYALDPCGRAITGLTMSLTRAGATVSAQTNAAGFYSFAGVQAGYSYTLAPTGSAYTFTPPSFAFPGLSANQTGNFTGRPPVSTADVLALADLYVRGGSATSNFGTAAQLITRLASNSKDTYETYLKFNVGQPCTVAAVKLRLYGQLSSSGNLPVAVYGVPATTWTETGTTWNSKPAAGALLRTVSVPGTTAAWYEWDVTDYVRAELAAGRSTVAFALKSTATTNYQVTFNSREASAGANAPRLAVTTP
ncbi:MAG TPA: carboxypeptidase regulatory-like domain-containing protein [Pyrinomonadaceae bacterium]|jgi:hypothetical protein